MVDISVLNDRNARVEANKAWETSWTRRLLIAGLTYGILVFYLPVLGVEQSYLHATVPVCGYLLSTLTLPLVKKFWLTNIYKTEPKI